MTARVVSRFLRARWPGAPAGAPAVALATSACAGGQTGEPTSARSCVGIEQEVERAWGEGQPAIAAWLHDASRAELAPEPWEGPGELPLSVTFEPSDLACRDGNAARVLAVVTLASPSGRLLAAASEVTVAPDAACTECYTLDALVVGEAENLELALPDTTALGVTRAWATLTLRLRGAPPALPTAHGDLVLRYRALNEPAERERRFAF